MKTLFVHILRIGWVSGVLLAVVALAALGVALVFAATSQPAGKTSAPSASAPRELITVSLAGARILPIDPSHLPAAQEEFVAVNIRFVNSGAVSSAYSMDSFRLRDLAGVTFSPDTAATYLVGASALPLQGTLQAGERRAGNLVFQIPISDHTATLLWLPDPASDTAVASWPLSL